MMWHFELIDSSSSDCHLVGTLWAIHAYIERVMIDWLGRVQHPMSMLAAIWNTHVKDMGKAVCDFYLYLPIINLNPLGRLEHGMHPSVPEEEDGSVITKIWGREESSLPVYMTMFIPACSTWTDTNIHAWKATKYDFVVTKRWKPSAERHFS